MDDKTPSMQSLPEEGSKTASETPMALATAPIQGEVAFPQPEMKPISYEMAMKLPGQELFRRLEKIGTFEKICDSFVRKTILAYEQEVRAAQHRYNRLKELFVPGMVVWKDAFARDGSPGKLFPFSYSYYRQVVRGGKKRKPKPLPKPEEKPKADVTVDAVPVSTFQVPPDIDGWLSFFSALTQEQRQTAYEAMRMLMDDPRGSDSRREAGYGVVLDCATDDGVDFKAFRPAVAVGDGNGEGCEPPQEDVPVCKVPVLEQEASSNGSFEAMEITDAGSLPCTTPAYRRGVKHVPVPIVLEDGRCGHVVAGMGGRTKRTMYGVRLEDGKRAEVRKKLYAMPANLGGMSLVPKAWLVDGWLPLEKTPKFLNGQVPAQKMAATS